jgi:GT2 family glycosyltransferase
MRPRIYLVAPRDAWERISSQNEDLFDELVEDPGLGLAAAINKGVQTMDASINVVGWLGDDDQMVPNAIESSLQILKARPLSVATFGDIEIIDKDGLKRRRMKARQSAPGLARFWTNHVYQPGSLVRRDSFVSINGLDESFGWAFDLDMFLKLSKLGEVTPNPNLVAKFRWHQDSLSAGSSDRSVKEASKVRINHLPAWLRPVAPIWELPHIKLALWLAKIEIK